MLKMKCDELKDYDYEPAFPFQSRGRFYIAEDVESAIVELKDCKDEWAKQCSRLTAENTELKQKLQNAEMKADLAEAANTEYREDFKKMNAAYNDMTDNYIKSQRALWLARANRSLEKIAWFKLWNASISTMNPEDGDRQEFDKWKKALGKFLAKADEYK